MKTLLAVCATLFLALGAANVSSAQEAAPASQAADVTGDWSGQMQGPNGDMTITFHLKQDGAKLTGNVETGMGDPVAIQNGKVGDGKIYWETSINGMTIQHDGTVNSDEIKIHVKSGDGQFPEMDMTLKRGKA